MNLNIIKSQQYSFFWTLVLMFLTISLYSQGNNFTVEVDPQYTTLDFGKFTPGVNSGTITVSPNGNYSGTPTGGIGILPFGSTPSAVRFNINAAGVAKVVTITTTTALLTGPGGNLTIDLIFDKNSYTTDKNSTTVVKMGGTLNVPANTTEGDYTGTINVIFSYQ